MSAQPTSRPGQAHANAIRRESAGASETAETVTTNGCSAQSGNERADAARSARFSASETAEAITTNGCSEQSGDERADAARSARFSTSETAEAVTTNSLPEGHGEEWPPYPPANWRLLITGYADGMTNMAIDEAIMRAVTEGLALPTLRFYAWNPPCISIGYSQSLASEIDLERCRRDGIDWVRRPTGGRAILHTDELTYSVVLPQDDPRAFGGVVESYRHLSRGLVAGLEQLKVNVVQASYQDKKDQPASAVCFDIPSHYEVTVDGRKLVGSAQTRRRNVVLQHGTLPLYGDITRLIDYLNLPSDAERDLLRVKLTGRAITLHQALGRRVELDDAVSAMRAGFAGALNLELTPGELTAEERRWAEELRQERYSQTEWNEAR
jgi:lipoyl(octanoyl) transferase